VLWRWPWCIVFACRVICLETIQCCRLSNRIKRLNYQSFFALFPHFTNINQSVLHSHILPIRLIPVCIDLWYIPDFTHLFHESVSLQLFDPLLLLFFLIHQPIFNPLPLLFLLNPYCCRLWSFHKLVLLLLPLIDNVLAHLILLCLVDLAHCDQSVTYWAVIQNLLIVLRRSHGMLAIFFVHLWVRVGELATGIICLLVRWGHLSVRSNIGIIFGSPRGPLKLQYLLIKVLLLRHKVINLLKAREFTVYFLV
jgi:hypothetical protein